MVFWWHEILKADSNLYIDILNHDSKHCSDILNQIQYFTVNVLNLDLIFSLSSKFHMILVHVLGTDINILPILCRIICKCYFCDRKQPGGWSVWGRKKSELGQQVPLLKKKWNIWGKSCFKWPWFWCNRIISMKTTSDVLNEV